MTLAELIEQVKNVGLSCSQCLNLCIVKFSRTVIDESLIHTPGLTLMNEPTTKSRTATNSRMSRINWSPTTQRTPAMLIAEYNIMHMYERAFARSAHGADVIHTIYAGLWQCLRFDILSPACIRMSIRERQVTTGREARIDTEFKNSLAHVFRVAVVVRITASKSVTSEWRWQACTKQVA